MKTIAHIIIYIIKINYHKISDKLKILMVIFKNNN